MHNNGNKTIIKTLIISGCVISIISLILDNKILVSIGILYLIVSFIMICHYTKEWD